MTATVRLAATFGSGGGEPYTRALQSSAPQTDGRPTSGLLRLVPDNTDGHDNAHSDDNANGTDSAENSHLTPPTVMDVRRWSSGADATDMSLLEEGSGPLLDIGCGPGRMVAAALTIGYAALGVDVSQAAVDVAHRSGVPALRASVFDTLPREGEWMTVLLVDGNIGIGGDPSALLRRCAELLSPTGSALVEVHNDAKLDRSFHCRVVGDDGAASDLFPWSEIGVTALESRALATGMRLSASWQRQGRSFARLVKS